MSYQSIPITERTEKLRSFFLSLPVPMEEDPYVDKKYRKFNTADRWITLGYLRGWKKHCNAETTRLRTSYAEAEELYEAEPLIAEEELLVGRLYLPEYTEEEQKEYDMLCDMFEMSSHTLTQITPKRDHLSLDFEKLLKLGISGIRAEIHEAMGKLDLNCCHDYPAYEVIKQHEFYRCCLIELDALSDLARRYAKKAAEMAESAAENRKNELIRIAETLLRVPEYPAGSFYEAMQSVQFFLGTLFGLYPLNRPDRYLYPYYLQDIQKGRLTKEEAQELVDQYCLHISTRVFTRAACGFMVGGLDANGVLVENDLTYMFITALDHLQLPDPNGAVAVCEQTSDELLLYCAEILSHGTTHPAFFNDAAIVASLEQNYGCPHEDAVNYIHTTCAEITVVGKTRAHTTAFMADLPQLLAKTVRELTNESDFDELLCHFYENIVSDMRGYILYYATRMLEASRNGNEPMRVCTLIDDCIGRGRSIFEGGEKYMFIQPIMIGFSNAVDSLAAIRSIVYEDRQMTLSAFNEIVEQNFEGHEELRQYIIRNLPHYGNDDAAVDDLAGSFGRQLQALFKENNLLFGNHMMPGTFSYVDHAARGALMGATFDGRLSGYSYSDGCSPVQGRDVNGPTAMINSLTSWEQSSLIGGMVVNVKFSKEHLRGDKQYTLVALLRTFIKQGGIELQVNAVDRATLEAARQSPEKYSNLQVRIGGFSDYFVRLQPELQQEIIDRTEY